MLCEGVRRCLALKVSLRVLEEFVLRAYFSHLNMASATFSCGSMLRSSCPNTSNRENPNAPRLRLMRSRTTSTTCEEVGSVRVWRPV